MNKEERDYERRKQLRLEKLGTNKPVCVLCGEDHWECLELHHLEGQSYGETLAIICRNCHRKLSVKQDSHPKQIDTPPSTDERLGHMLVGLHDFLILLAKNLKQFGDALLQRVKDAAQERSVK